MHRLGLRLVLGGALGVIAGSCHGGGSKWSTGTESDDGDGTGTCPVGTVGCPCTQGGLCDPGLECRSNICVDTDGDDGGSGSDSGGTGDGGSDGTSDDTGGTGGTSGDTGGTGDTSGTTGTGETTTSTTDTTTSTATSTAPFCGDGAQDDGEECDGSDLASHDCTDHGFAGGALGCDGSCQYDTSGCNNCGDGNVDADEACDCGGAGSPCTAGELDNNTCADHPPFTNGTLDCHSPGNCTFDTSGCYYCGDGIKNGTEECDDSDLAGQDCIDHGFTGGTLDCYGSCMYDTSGCTGVTEITECSTPNVSIPDVGNVVDTITVAQAGTITDVNVLVQVSHGWVEDLDIQVQHLGADRWLVRDQCGDGYDINATFNDEGSTLVCDFVFSPAISGHVIPEESLVAYDGLQALGDWHLQVFDDEALLVGTLDHWCVTISY